MSDNDFYISLESNGDLVNHPANSQNKFKITLQTPIDLRGEWETGLAQIIFPYSWHEKIIKEKDEHHHHLFFIKLHVRGDGGDDVNKVEYWRDLHISPTNYHTIKDILLALRNAVEQSKKNMVQFIYWASGVGGAVDMDHLRINCINGALLALPIELAKVMSYNVEKMEQQQWTEQSGISIQRIPNTNNRKWMVISTTDDYAGRQFIPSPLSEHITIKMSEAEGDMGIFQNIYINSDLIQTQYVGETRANVLRIIAPVQKKGQVETFNFAPIFYLPLRIIKFNTIKKI